MFGTTGGAFGGFGATSTAAFSFSRPASSATTSLFGAPQASSAGLFGAAPTSAPSLFGAPQASSASLFGAPAASAPSLFGLPQASSASLFGGSATFGGLGFGAAQPQQPQRVGFLTKDGRPATYTTKWDELKPETQEELKRREEVYREARNKCRVLDGNERLKDSVALLKTLEEEASSLSTSLRGLSNQLEADKEELGILRQDVKGMLEDTEIAVATFCRAKLRQENADYANLPPVLPDEYLKKTALRLETTAAQYQRLVEELEEVLAPAGNELGAPGPQAMSAIMANLHDFFLHVGAKVEELHSQTASAKEAHLKARLAAGDYRDPFDEADRKEAAKREAALAKVPVVPVAVTPTAPAIPGMATAAASTPGLFAAGAASMPGFGASSAAASTFGAPLAGRLGATSTAGFSGFAGFAPAAASTPAFGALGAATSAPSFGFGATSAAAPSFGAAPAATPAFGGGMFGAAAPPTFNTAAAGAFGSFVPTAATAAAPKSKKSTTQRRR
mmetsp:Transcript_16884/g.36726  ORF Transcript_16884/g.36726 Transcript_16884/m.36726 type:complete len:505 (-) Transcript_16884:129-1643(-)